MIFDNVRAWSYEKNNAIIRVIPKEVFLNNIYDRTSYICTVLEVLKGTTEEEIRVIAFKNALILGKEYLVLLSGNGNGAYTMASLNSIFPSDYKLMLK